MFEGMPWPLLIPMAIIALIYGATISKKEMAARIKKIEKKRSKRNEDEYSTDL